VAHVRNEVTTLSFSAVPFEARTNDQRGLPSRDIGVRRRRQSAPSFSAGLVPLDPGGSSQRH
jgi:hypothetical protein